MMEFLHGLVWGLMIGASAGVVIAGLLFTGRRADDNIDKLKNEACTVKNIIAS